MADDPFRKLKQDLTDNAEIARREAVVKEALALGINVESVSKRGVRNYKSTKKVIGNRFHVDRGVLTEADAAILALQLEIKRRQKSK